MGNRLHICKKHVIEYGDAEYFNYQCEEFHQLMDALEVEYTEESFDEDFEIQREDFERGLWKLKNIQLLTEREQEEIEDAARNLNLSFSDLIGILDKYLEESDPNNDYMVFSFF